MTKSPIAHLLVLKGPTTIRRRAINDIARFFDFFRRDGGFEGIANGVDLVVDFGGVDVAVRRRLARRDDLAR